MAAYARWADLNQPEQQAATVRRGLPGQLSPWRLDRRARGADREAAHRADRVLEYQPPRGQYRDRLRGPRYSATAQSAVIAWHRRNDGSEWTLYGRYVDRWTRTEAGWRLAERELRAAGAVGRDDRQLLPLGRASGALSLSGPASHHALNAAAHLPTIGGPMRSLVLGGSTFVGRRLVHLLAGHGHEVGVLNRGRTPSELPPGRPPVRRRSHRRRLHAVSAGGHRVGRHLRRVRLRDGGGRLAHRRPARAVRRTHRRLRLRLLDHGLPAQPADAVDRRPADLGRAGHQLRRLQGVRRSGGPQAPRADRVPGQHRPPGRDLRPGQQHPGHGDRHVPAAAAQAAGAAAARRAGHRELRPRRRPVRAAAGHGHAPAGRRGGGGQRDRAGHHHGGLRARARRDRRRGTATSTCCPTSCWGRCPARCSAICSASGTTA